MERTIMSVKRSPFAPSRQLVDAVMDGYISWREASAAVTSAYQAWRRADPADRAQAFHEYDAALDREERAADEYRRLVELVHPA
jgi:hypothetical protein